MKHAAEVSGHLVVLSSEFSVSVLEVWFVLATRVYTSTAVLPGITLELFRSCL